MEYKQTYYIPPHNLLVCTLILFSRLQRKLLKARHWYCFSSINESVKNVKFSWL